VRYLLALGANLGDRAANLERGLALLAQSGVDVTARGAVVETAAWAGDSNLPFLNLPFLNLPFLNLVVEVETGHRPWALLALAKEIELRLGRDPAAARNAPRPLDVDLLACAGTTISSPQLTLPHPRLAGRDFLREPLRTLPTIAEWRASLS
jgi:2-amino-4-hydroxy-6-hydroxymethyldihydropteridine diphosphokinase